MSFIKSFGSVGRHAQNNHSALMAVAEEVRDLAVSCSFSEPQTGAFRAYIKNARDAAYWLNKGHKMTLGVRGEEG